MKFHFLAIQTSHESKLGKRHFHRHVSRGRRDEAPIDDRSSLERKHSFHSLMHIHATDITRNNFAPRAIAVYFCIFCKERGRERERERERQSSPRRDLGLSDETEYAKAAVSKTPETRRYVARGDK